jgi:hypothetical protein
MDSITRGAISLLALSAMLGSVLLWYILQERRPSVVLVLMQALTTVAGIFLLVMHGFENEWNTSNIISVVLFIPSIVAGGWMLVRYIKHLQVRKGMAIMHALLSITAFIVMLILAD